MDEQERKLNLKDVPAVIMLAAGAVASIVMIATGVNTKRFLTTLLIVLILFYILGSIVRVVLDKAFRVMETKKVDLGFEELNMDDLLNGSDEDAVLQNFGDEDFDEEEDSYIVEERES